MRAKQRSLRLLIHDQETNKVEDVMTSAARRTMGFVMGFIEKTYTTQKSINI